MSRSRAGVVAAVAVMIGVVVPQHAAGKAVVKRGDLTVTRAAVKSPQAAPGDTLDVSWTVKNRGRGNVRKTTTRVLLSRDSKLDRKDVTLASAAEVALKRGKAGKRSRRVRVPSTTKPATYRLLVCADVAKKVREAKESNNCRVAGKLRVVARPATLPAPAPAPAVLSVAIGSPGQGATLREKASVTVRATSSRGLRSLDIWVGPQRVGGTTEAGPLGEATRTVEIDVSALLNGASSLEATATDAAGDRAVAQPVAVSIDNPLGPEGPTTGLVLKTPVALNTLEPTLRASGAKVVEYFHERPAPPAPDLPTELSGVLSQSGVSIVQPGTTTTGGFYARGLNLDTQTASYRAAYQDDVPGAEPAVFGLRVEGTVSAATLGPLGDLVEDSVDVAPGARFSAAGERARLRPPSRVKPDPAPRKPGAPAVAPLPAEPAPWWPTYGQLDTHEFTVEKTVPNSICSIIICLPFGPIPRTVKIDEKRVKFTHDLVWTRAALAVYDAEDRAYEHDFKIDGGGRYGTRPFCVPGDERDSFYASRGGGVKWEATVPDGAAAYLDADASDSCTTADLTIGIAFPEKLDDDVPAGKNAAYRLTLDVARGKDDGSFTLTAQTLDRDTAFCDHLPKWLMPNCIGIDTSKTYGGFILRTEGERMPGVKLPVCVAWMWLPTGASGDGADRLARCGFDRDHDGYEDDADCAPDDAGVNPGAVDIPNDGIDQNCDGADVIVGSGAAQVTLIWDNEADMDLHVVEPNGRQIWYGSPGPTSTLGELDRDDNVCGSPNLGPGGVENVFWPSTTSAPQGTYQVAIVEYGRCDEPEAADWILEIRVGGHLIRRTTGTGGGYSTTFTVSA